MIKKKHNSNSKEQTRVILEEDYTIMRDVYQNQPINISSNGNVSVLYNIYY